MKLNLKIVITIIIFSQFTYFTLAQSVSFSVDNIKKYSLALSNDSMLGRGNGQKGLKIAESYITNELKKNPDNLKNIIKQTFPVLSIETKPESEFKIINDFGSKQLIMGVDYLVHSSGTMSYIPNPVDVVFVGYGIFAPEYDYNDFQNLDINGKAVILLGGEPESSEPDYFSGEIDTRHSLIETKQKNAISRGAIACIIVPNQKEFKFKNWNYWKNDYSEPEFTLLYYPTNILTFILNPESFKELLSAELKIKEAENYNQLKQFNLNTKISYKGIYKDKSFQLSNIIYRIDCPKENKSDECLIVTAHYDHLGIGKPIGNDSIYNGFMDNSLGVACLMELADKFTRIKDSLKRNLVFIFTAGEEKGLLGSTYYLNNPLFPLYKTIANVNIDGVPYIDKFKSIIGIGSKFSTIDSILDLTASQQNLNLDEIPPFYDETASFNRSDQIAFAYSGIPSVLVSDGLNYLNANSDEALNRLIDFMNNIYHTPKDDISQRIDYDAVMQYIQFMFEFITNLINSDKAPEWYSGTGFYMERLRSQAEKR